MRAALITGVAAVGLAAVAFTIAARPGDEPSEGVTAGEQDDTGDGGADQRRQWPHDPDAEQLVQQLAEAGLPADRRKLAQLYAKWGGDDTKVHARRAIIDALLAEQDPKRALADLLSAIDLDRAVDGADDPTVDYAAKELRALWKIPEMFEHGRDRMLSARTDKSRGMLADSLSGYVSEDEDFVDPGQQRRAWLGSDLADAHAVTQQSWAKTKIRDGMAKTMGEDVAKVLDDPLGVGPAEIESLQEELSGVRDAVDSVPSDHRKPLKGLENLDDDELLDAVDEPRADSHQRKNPHHR